MYRSDALQFYQRENGTQPNMVIVYRDGVGEGQIDYVREHEIAAIKVSLSCGHWIDNVCCFENRLARGGIYSTRTDMRLFNVKKEMWKTCNITAIYVRKMKVPSHYNPINICMYIYLFPRGASLR